MKTILKCFIICIVAVITYKVSCLHIDNIIKNDIKRIEKSSPCSFNGKYITLHNVEFKGPFACPNAKIDEVKMEVELSELFKGNLKICDVLLNGVNAHCWGDSWQGKVESNIKRVIIEGFDDRITNR